MARMTKESLEAKIKKAEERVVRTGEIYNATCEEFEEVNVKHTYMAENHTIIPNISRTYIQSARENLKNQYFWRSNYA